MEYRIQNRCLVGSIPRMHARIALQRKVNVGKAILYSHEHPRHSLLATPYTFNVAYPAAVKRHSNLTMRRMALRFVSVLRRCARANIKYVPTPRMRARIALQRKVSGTVAPRAAEQCRAQRCRCSPQSVIWLLYSISNDDEFHVINLLLDHSIYRPMCTLNFIIYG